MADATELLHGTLDTLILKTLAWGPRHGYAIARWLETLGEGALQIEEGSLYPALYRMTRKKWIRGQWGTTENNRRAKYYSLTAEGKRQLQEQVSGWERFAAAVSQAVSSKHAPSWAR